MYRLSFCNHSHRRIIPQHSPIIKHRRSALWNSFPLELRQQTPILHRQSTEQNYIESSCIDLNNSVVVGNVSEKTHKNENQRLKTYVCTMYASTHGQRTSTSTSTLLPSTSTTTLDCTLERIDFPDIVILHLSHFDKTHSSSHHQLRYTSLLISTYKVV